VSDVTRSSVTLSWLAPMSDAGAAIVACVVGRVKPVSPDDSPMSPFQTEIKTQRPLGLLALRAADVGAAMTSRDTWRPSSAPC